MTFYEAELDELGDFLAISYFVNITYPEDFLNIDIRFEYFEHNDTFLFDAYENTFVYLALLCMKEGYFIKYSPLVKVEDIPVGFNSSYLGLHTALHFYNLDTSQFSITNVSFWRISL